MGSLRKIWKPLIRGAVAGRWRGFELRPAEPPFPTHLKRLGLYLHVPFCRNLCPYCPYNREECSPKAFALYERAVLQEIDAYAERMRPEEVVSLYVGGGTPTVEPTGLARILGRMLERFPRPGNLCVELHPSNMDGRCLSTLRGSLLPENAGREPLFWSLLRGRGAGVSVCRMGESLDRGELLAQEPLDLAGVRSLDAAIRLAVAAAPGVVGRALARLEEPGPAGPVITPRRLNPWPSRKDARAFLAAGFRFA